jgi:t-SNARE complex subunit (syntaxin)
LQYGSKGSESHQLDVSPARKTGSLDMSRLSQLRSIAKSIEEIQKLKEYSQVDDQVKQIDPTRLSQLNQKEKELNQLLMSGLENFQPQLNMFGSNVFSSVESGARGSIDIQSVVRSIDGLVNLKTRQSHDGA